MLKPISGAGAAPERDGDERAFPRLYSAFGLSIRSEFYLPEFEPAGPADPAAPVIALRRGDLSGPLPALQDLGRGYYAGPQDLLLDWPGVGRIRVRDGVDMIVDPAAGVTDLGLRAMVLAGGLAGLFHQRRMLVLHGSAVARGDRVSAFIGPSGAGKSTLAAHLHRRGYPIVGDDLCVVHMDGAAPPLVYPGIVRLKLWRDTAEALDLVPEDLERVLPALDKYQLPVTRPDPRQGLFLDHIFILEPGGMAETAIAPLRGIAGIAALRDHTYRPFLIPALDNPRWHHERCARLAGTLALHHTKLSRSQGPGAVDIAPVESLLAEKRAHR